MSKRGGLSKGGFLFIFCLIGAAIYDSIYRLVTGHFYEHWGYTIWGLIAVSILADAEQYFSDIRENTEDLKKQSETMSNNLDLLKIEIETLKEKVEIYTDTARELRRK